MLLNLLTKEEKFYFIDLLVKVISVDGTTNEMEMQIINKLKYEMGDDALRYRKSNLSLEKLIDYFATKPKVTKNLVFLNLLSASLADEFYSVEEHFLLEQIQNSLEIPRKKRTELVKAVYADRDLREKVKRIISE
ncbi:MAG TPA: hypothetical protein PKG96_03300 [Bacilli bacterium]|jgi:hypothetical protein|nr:hypothetical protein [Bacilli bacterium]NLT01871.1 hypothetical protein [Acholeplasmataceae bacterium]HNZ77387.1 hypothetical protein [Bacilli bacterium]HOD61128.1 hypothetical protein [Bacilli bacterium]HOE06531.1 hypothetical protein [Bacilli bacterium]